MEFVLSVAVILLGTGLFLTRRRLSGAERAAYHAVEWVEYLKWVNQTTNPKDKTPAHAER